jgi:diguanylate cyclase (GGDEF)-like protein
MLNGWKRLRSRPLRYVVHLLASFVRRSGRAQRRINAELGSIIAKLRKAHSQMGRNSALQDARLTAALHHLPVGLSIFDPEHRLVACNRAYREIYDVPEELTRPGTPFTELMRYYVKRETGRDEPEELDNVREWIAGHFAKLACGKPFTDTQHLSDGRTVLARVGPIADGGWVDVLEDITERLQNEAKISHMAQHDALTDLPNRMLLSERLEQALKGARRGENVAVLCLDLDRFKEVNDTLGHSVGDALLKTVAERLRSTVRPSDAVARVGGDEFVVLQISAYPAHEAAVLASRLIEVISAPYELNGHQAVIGTSVGIAVAPDDGANPETFLAHADMALYRAKEDGRGTFCFYEQEMNARAHARRDLERDLRLALANGDFELYYQPLVNLERNEVSGFEALLRWRHPQRGMVSPGDFIPLAEETGLIVPIGEWALREACAEAATWPGHIKIAVNLSPVQFKIRKLVDMVFNALAAAGLDARRLELEITESVLLQDSEATRVTLRQLHDLGVRIAMDDFGTGYSSLNYLQRFPFDTIKIDRCFIANLSTGDESSLAIVRAIGSLGRALGLAVTAEGVETQQQLEMVRLEGCTEMQGYIFSAAKPASEIRRHFLPRPDELASLTKTAVA